MRSRSRLLLDLVIFVGYLAATNTAATGIPVHEWLSVALAVVVAVHLATQWDWTVRLVANITRRLLTVSTVHLIVDIVLFIAFILVMLSGLFVSVSIAPVLGLSVPFGPTWRLVHALSARVALPILGVHIGLHWRWIGMTVRRYLIDPLTARRRELATVGAADPEPPATRD